MFQFTRPTKCNYTGHCDGYTYGGTSGYEPTFTTTSNMNCMTCPFYGDRTQLVPKSVPVVKDTDAVLKAKVIKDGLKRLAGNRKSMRY